MTRESLEIKCASEEKRRINVAIMHGVSAGALTPDPGDLNHAEVVHLPLKMG
jgi:hypothetical protein